jgi:hypothetical protein
MNLCEKSGVLANNSGLFCSPRKTMFFAGDKKDLLMADEKTGFRAKRDKKSEGDEEDEDAVTQFSLTPWLSPGVWPATRRLAVSTAFSCARVSC